MAPLAAVLRAAGAAAGLLGAATAEAPRGLGSEEASVLIQTVARADGKPEFPLVPLIQWATGNEHFKFPTFAMPSQEEMKKASSIVKGLINVASQKPGDKLKAKPTRPPKQTAEERDREPVTRENLRATLGWLMKELQVPGVMRAGVAGWLAPEVMDYRRKAPPQQRLLMDNVLAIKLNDVSLANVHTKASDLIQAFNASGLTALAKSMDLGLPMLKIMRFFSKEAQGNATQLDMAKRFSREVAAVPAIAAMPDASQTFQELAALFEANDGRKTPATAMQLLKELHKTDPAPLVPIIADSIFSRLQVLNNTVQPAYLVHDLAHYMRTGGMSLPLKGPAEAKGMEPWARFADDMATMVEQGRAKPENQLPRIGQFVSELGIVSEADLAQANSMLQNVSRTGGYIDTMIDQTKELLDEMKVEHKKDWASVVQFTLKPLLCSIENANTALQLCKDSAAEVVHPLQ